MDDYPQVPLFTVVEEVTFDNFSGFGVFMKLDQLSYQTFNTPQAWNISTRPLFHDGDIGGA